MSRRASVVCALALCACAGESDQPVNEARSQAAALQAAPLQAPFFRFFALPATRDGGPAASEAEQFVTLGDRVFFVARASGDPLVWVTDGTDPGTTPVSTISLEYVYPPSAAKLVAFDGGVFFAGVDRDPLSSSRLIWVRTEGDPQHTQILQPVRSFAPTGEQVAFGGALFIVATDFDHGEELWKSNGTESGTVIFKDILPGEFSSNPTNLIVIGSTLFFTANDGRGRTLWKSDGTPEGTVRVSDPDGGPINPTNMSVSNGRIFFAAEGPGGNEPWMSDGSPGGTVRLIDALPGDEGSNPHSFVRAGTSTAFLAGPSPDQQRFWRWNGSAAHAETDAGWIGSALVALDRKVLYTIAGPPGWGLWASDGTSEPMFLHPLNGFYAALMVDPVVFDQKVYFGATDSAYPAQNELWVSDGTPGGTHPAFASPVASQAANPHRLAATPLGLLFSAGTYDWTYPYWAVSELWRSDGSANGTHPIIAPVLAGASSMPETPVVSGSEIFWATSLGDLPSTLWHSNGNGNATPVAGIPPSIVPTLLVPVPGGVLAGNGYSSGSLLLVKPDAGTQPLPLPPYFGSWAALDTFTVFGTFGNATGPGAVWVSDGTVEGTKPLEGLPTDGGADNPFAFARLGDRVYFLAGSAQTLFSTDGKTGSVVFSLPANEYFLLGPPWPIAVIGDRLYLASYQRMYVWDGAEAREAFPFEYPVGPPQQLFGTSNRLIFSSNGMVFSFDGSDAGAQLIAGSPSQFFDFLPFGAVGDQVYFRHREWDAHGTLIDALWTSDGTDAGTRFVASVQFEEDLYYPTPPPVALPLEPEGRIVFPAHSRFAGTELWVSDGTQSGTRPIVEIARGPLGSRPGRPVRFGSTLVVPAETSVTGRELWSIDLAAVTDNVPPELTCPTDVSVTSSDPTGKTVSFTPVAHDAVSEVQLVSQPTSGSKFPIGGTQVQVRATDAFGNARTCTFSVAVTLVIPDGGSPPPPPPPQPPSAKSGCSVTGGDSASATGHLALLGLLALVRPRNRARGSSRSNVRPDRRAAETD